MKLQGNILILTQWSFKDALVQTYTLPYVDIIRKVLPEGRKIIVVTAEQQHISMSQVELNALNEEWEKKNMQLFAQEYKKFGWRKLLSGFSQLFRLYQLIKKEKISVIHAFCTPAGGMGYLLCQLTGAKLIVDSYEPHAEAMVENGTWKKNGFAFKMLWQLEKKETKKASFLIATTEGMKQYAKDKYKVTIKNFFVKPACVDLDKFFPQEKNKKLLEELGLFDKIVCVYAGKLGGIYLKKEVFDFIKTCYDYWGERFRFLLLTNVPIEEIKQQLKQVDLPEHIVISRFVSHQEIPAYLSLGDFAINPVKPVPTKKYCTSIKDGEYWAMGLPIVITPDISNDSEIIEKEKIGVVVNFAEKAKLSEAVIQIEKLLLKNSEMKKIIRKVAEKYRSFENARSIYQKIYAQSFE
ncbi:MAG: glycosyltransferase [Chitinophagaceae bacterium]|nr:MAG: glycosyltransferase [Chitinophagaceae bacterium]